MELRLVGAVEALRRVGNEVQPGNLVEVRVHLVCAAVQDDDRLDPGGAERLLSFDQIVDLAAGNGAAAER